MVRDRTLNLALDESQLREESLLDGCYVIKTDLPKEAAKKQTIHARYKDLAKVESAFRTCKTRHEETYCPIRTYVGRHPVELR